MLSNGEIGSFEKPLYLFGLSSGLPFQPALGSVARELWGGFDQAYIEKGLDAR